MLHVRPISSACGMAVCMGSASPAAHRARGRSVYIWWLLLNLLPQSDQCCPSPHPTHSGPTPHTPSTHTTWRRVTANNECLLRRQRDSCSAHSDGTAATTARVWPLHQASALLRAHASRCHWHPTVPDHACLPAQSTQSEPDEHPEPAGVGALHAGKLHRWWQPPAASRSLSRGSRKAPYLYSTLRHN